MATSEFEATLAASLPKMRSWAVAITRNAHAADDLVQDVAIRALTFSGSFTPGTNFLGWLHRIMINQYISGVRRKREFNDIEDLPEPSIPASQQDRMELQTLGAELSRLPQEQRQALMHIALENLSYEDASAITGCPVGTLKSRVHRARMYLRAQLEGEAIAA